MINVFSVDECKKIIDFSNSLNWEYVDDNFKYYQVFFTEDWISNRVMTSMYNIKGIYFNDVITKVLKLKKGDRLPTHNQNFENTDISFTLVCFLNTDFDGGTYYYNHENTNYQCGQGFIHDKASTQKIDKIKQGECYLLFSHFTKIVSDKLI